MTVRVKYLLNGTFDRGAGLPKTITGTGIADDAIPLESRLMQGGVGNSIALNIDNAAFLAQIGVGKVLVADYSIQDYAPAIAPAPAPVSAQLIAVNDWPNKILQFGSHWCNEDIWGAGSLTRGPYTGISGTTYEQQFGVSQQLGPNGEGSARFTWKWPTGTTEVKSYQSILDGNKPGWANTWVNPGGFDIILPDGSVSQTYPSGKTPNSIFPIALPVPSLKSTVAYTHNQTPTNRGHLTYDIFLQNKPDQVHGFNADLEIAAEIMIPLDYWGGYGAYVPGGGGRNPNWYVKDATIDGRLWHCFRAVPHDPNNIQNNTFTSPWNFIVFEPDVPGIQPGTIDLAAFINYAVAQNWTVATPGIVAGATHVVSVEFGIEPEDGTGDISVSNYRVY